MKEIMRLLNQKSLVAASFSCFFFLAGMGALCTDTHSQSRFDPQRWMSVQLYGDDRPRQRLVTSLTAKHKLVGMTKEKALNLLGPQSDPAYFKDYDLRYWLGPQRNPYSGIDSEWLVLKVKNDRIVEYSIVTDSSW